VTLIQGHPSLSGSRPVDVCSSLSRQVDICSSCPVSVTSTLPIPDFPAPAPAPAPAPTHTPAPTPASVPVPRSHSRTCSRSRSRTHPSTLECHLARRRYSFHTRHRRPHHYRPHRHRSCRILLAIVLTIAASVHTTIVLPLFRIRVELC